MIPDPRQALTDLAGKLATGIAPETSTLYTASNTAMISMLLVGLSEELEHGVENRLCDIHDMKALFEQAIAAGPPAETASRMATYMALEPRDNSVQTLTAHHAQGLETLIEMHAWAETAQPDIDQAVWAFLTAYAERHAFATGI